MEVEFLTADTALPAPAVGHAGAAGQQHRQGHGYTPAGRRSCGGGGGRQRDQICPQPHRGAGGGRWGAAP